VQVCDGFSILAQRSRCKSQKLAMIINDHCTSHKSRTTSSREQRNDYCRKKFKSLLTSSTFFKCLQIAVTLRQVFRQFTCRSRSREFRAKYCSTHLVQVEHSAKAPANNSMSDDFCLSLIQNTQALDKRMLSLVQNVETPFIIKMN
jgi:hypothetical protein